ncbi:cytochrome P450 714C2 [Trifolium repens]|nr:cytochrome P450 714C2 [Trifolium repens]
MKLQFDSQFFTSILFIGFVALLLRLYTSFVHKPNVLRSKLKKQGINGPPPTILLGNLIEIMKSQLTTPNSHSFLTHNTASLVFPKFEEWRKQYGEVFMFSFGNIQSLCVSQTDMIKEFTTCTSFDLGLPPFHKKLFGPLLGDGILTSNGTTWAHHRKTLAPELYIDKVKGMVNIVSESGESLLNLWNSKIEAQSGGVADININEDLKIFSGNVISRACFGSDYSKGEEIFLKLGTLQEVGFSWKNLSSAVPGMRYLPTKTNRKSWILAKEVKSLILEVVKERKEKTSFEKDLLQMVIEDAKKSNLTQEAGDRFIIDNCKNIYLAGFESTAVVSSWCLMLLATNQNWQDRARAEVLEICSGRIPDYDMLSKMKQLTMIIHETLRLYPPAPLLLRHAFKDMKFGSIDIPKGTGLWILTISLHTNPDIWGDDANIFNPERFANGVAGACKHPHAYMPFGVGPRICLGQNLAMLELKMLIALILSNFCFSLSPRYIHSPALGITMKPDHGVQLLVTKL